MSTPDGVVPTVGSGEIPELDAFFGGTFFGWTEGLHISPMGPEDRRLAKPLPVAEGHGHHERPAGRLEFGDQVVTRLLMPPYIVATSNIGRPPHVDIYDGGGIRAMVARDPGADYFLPGAFRNAEWIYADDHNSNMPEEWKEPITAFLAEVAERWPGQELMFGWERAR